MYLHPMEGDFPVAGPCKRKTNRSSREKKRRVAWFDLTSSQTVDVYKSIGHSYRTTTKERDGAKFPKERRDRRKKKELKARKKTPKMLVRRRQQDVPLHRHPEDYLLSSKVTDEHPDPARVRLTKEWGRDKVSQLFDECDVHDERINELRWTNSDWYHLSRVNSRTYPIYLDAVKAARNLVAQTTEDGFSLVHPRVHKLAKQMYVRHIRCDRQRRREREARMLWYPDSSSSDEWGDVRGDESDGLCD